SPARAGHRAAPPRAPRGRAGESSGRAGSTPRHRVAASSARLRGIARHIEAPGALPEAPHEAGPPDAVPAVRIEVPARAPAGVPHAVAQTPLGLAVEGLVHVGPDLHGPQAVAVH